MTPALVLEAMHPVGQGLALLRRPRGAVLTLHVMQQALTSARDSQQLSITLFAPAPRQAERLEC